MYIYIYMYFMYILCMYIVCNHPGRDKPLFVLSKTFPSSPRMILSIHVVYQIQDDYIYVYIHPSIKYPV